MNGIEKRELYAQAYKKWGNSQMDMVIEECAELIQAINKLRRKPSAETIKNICGEIADVEIMTEQLRYMLNKDGVIDNIKEEKLERLQKLLS